MATAKQNFYKWHRILGLSPYPGDLVDVERPVAPVHVKLVQANHCAGGV
jgi:hypothetical protein